MVNVISYKITGIWKNSIRKSKNAVQRFVWTRTEDTGKDSLSWDQPKWKCFLGCLLGVAVTKLFKAAKVLFFTQWIHFHLYTTDFGFIAARITLLFLVTFLTFSSIHGGFSAFLLYTTRPLTCLKQHSYHDLCSSTITSPQLFWSTPL